MKRFLCSCLALVFFCCWGCGSVAVSAGGNLEECRLLPILMYHSILKDPARTGKYILSPDRLESDIRYLMERGYETVTLAQLTDYANGRGDLPEKPVLLTFDDGYLNNLTYVLPLLETYDCVAVVSVVGSYSQKFSDVSDPNPNYAHLSWDDIAALAESGRFEIENHTWDMHGQSGRMGSGRKRGESESAYSAAFTADVGRLQTTLQREVGLTPTFFTYPFGIIDPLSRPLLLDMGFCGSFTCAEKINTVVSGSPDCLWSLGRYNRPGTLSTEAFMQHVFDETYAS